MNEEYLKRVWMNVVAEAAGLGPLAIREQAGKAHYDRAHVSSVEVYELGDHAYKVRVGYTPLPTREIRYVEIGVRDNMPRDRPYALYEEFIAARQREMPAHLAGRTHNVDQFMHDKILELVRRRTGYEGLHYGDLWVHSCPTLTDAQAVLVRQEGAHAGMVAFGHLTRAGEIAMRKFMEVEFGPEAEPVYADPCKCE